jgi:hypothetical protein
MTPPSRVAFGNAKQAEPQTGTTFCPNEAQATRSACYAQPAVYLHPAAAQSE